MKAMPAFANCAAAASVTASLRVFRPAGIKLCRRGTGLSDPGCADNPKHVLSACRDSRLGAAQLQCCNSLSRSGSLRVGEDEYSFAMSDGR